MNRAGASPVISTVIVTATLLVMLMVASFLAANLLAVQVESAEFEQAKTGMLLLNELVADVAMRPGAASSLRVGQRSGGIGIYEAPQLTIMNGSETLYPTNQSTRFYVVKYRGGSMTPTADAVLHPPNGEALGYPARLVVDSTGSIGCVRVEARDGAWIVLDYMRVKVTSNTRLILGNTTYNVTDITVIRLVPGTLEGSGGTVTVRNTGYSTHPLTVKPGSTLTVQVGGASEQIYISGSGGTPLVRLIEVAIEVSIG
ncbi:MAG: hypothetical protein QFX33_02240 [Candidatus Nezhaarchaeota archaeon]|nr:hypothetical protein [Candidatus Nezhaarchaeota archaeon]